MSWITNIEGKPDPNYKDDGPKVADPAIPDRMVSTKRANQPFLKCVLASSKQQQHSLTHFFFWL